MFDKYSFLKELNKVINEKEHIYNASLENFELVISKINRGIIHGRKEDGLINRLKQCVADITKASYELELAYFRKNSFLQNGVVKYE